MATKKKAAKQKPSTPPSKRWSAKVTSDSTHPGPGLFKKSGKAIAAEMAKKSVSPRGLGQAVQMISFYENRAGKNLPAERKQALETAKKVLHQKSAAKKSAKKPPIKTKKTASEKRTK